VALTSAAREVETAAAVAAAPRSVRLERVISPI